MNRFSNEIRAATGGAAITTNTPFKVSVGLVASVDVTVAITFADGSVVAAYPLQKGYNPIQATNVVFASGAIVALYN